MQFSFHTIESSPFWKFHVEIKEICQPLFEHFGINYFDYSRFYPDNTCISLSSDPFYLRYLVDKDEYFCAAGRLLPGKYLWHHYINLTFLESTQKAFDYFHGITYVRHTEEYLEEINFAGSIQYSNILSLFAEKDEILDYFISHFLYQISPFLKRNSHSRIILPSDFIEEVPPEEEQIEELHKFIHALNKKSQLRKNTFLIHLNNQSITLTQREIQCLSHLKNGLSAKLIARQMNISPRTVEIFLKKILTKAGQTSRSQLLSGLSATTSIIVDKLASCAAST